MNLDNDYDLNHFVSNINLQRLFMVQKLTVVNCKSVDLLTTLTYTRNIEDQLQDARMARMLKLAFCCCIISEFLNDETSNSNSRNKSMHYTQTIDGFNDNLNVEKNDSEIFQNQGGFKKELEKVDVDVIAKLLFHQKSAKNSILENILQ